MGTKGTICTTRNLYKSENLLIFSHVGPQASIEIS